MAYTQVLVGAVANDNTGDPIRDAFIKVNNVMTALDLNFAVSSTLVIGDDPANLGTPAGFENTISSGDGTDDDITITPDGTGSIVLDGLSWPQADGTANFVLFTDGGGQIGFVSKLTDLVDDTSPQLGGDLDINSNSIVSTSDGDIILDPNGSGDINLLPDTGNINLNPASGTVILGNDLDIGSSSIISLAGLDITITPNGTGDIILGTIIIDADQVVDASTTGYSLFKASVTGLMTLGVGPQSTTAALEDEANAVNVDDNKVQGYQVYNTTTDIPVWASGNGPNDVWNDAQGATEHTPVT